MRGATARLRVSRQIFSLKPTPMFLIVLVLSFIGVGPIEAKADAPLIDGITLFGNHVTKDHILLRELGVQPGDPLYPQDVTQARINLEALPFIEYADIMEKRVGPDRVHLMIQVEEISRIDVEIFSDYNHLPRHINFISGLGASVQNFRGRAEELSLTSVAPWHAGYALRWSTPWFLGLPRVRFFAEGYWQRFDYKVEPLRLEERGAEVGLSYNLTRHLRLDAGYNYRRLEVDRSQDASLEGTTFDPSIRAGLELDLRDRKAYPRRGLLASVDHWWSKPGSDTPYRIFRGHVAGFIPLPTGSIFCQRFTYRGGNQSLPFYQKSYLGGDYDLRGLGAGALRGDKSVMATLELRHPVLTLPLDKKTQLNIGAHAFSDWGKTWDHNQTFADIDFSNTWGLGLHFSAGNGTLRMEWLWAETGYKEFIISPGWTF